MDANIGELVVKGILVAIAAVALAIPLAGGLVMRRRDPASGPVGGRPRGTTDRHAVDGEGRDAPELPGELRELVHVTGPDLLRTMADVAGADTVRRRLCDLAEQTLRPPPAGTPGRPPVGPILLHGPRGAGKTLLTEALAGHFRATLVHVSARLLIPADLARNEPVLPVVLHHARRLAPAVLVLDHLEALVHHPARSRALAAAHVLHNELTRRSRAASLVVVGCYTTDHGPVPASMLAAFPHAVPVALPDPSARIVLLERLATARGVMLDAPVDVLVALTAGMAPARIIEVLGRAAGRAELEQGPGAVVSEAHLRSALHHATAPRFVDELAVSRELKPELQRLAGLLGDPTIGIGVVLAGDAGTGRSTVARALAHTTGRTVVSIGSSCPAPAALDPGVVDARVTEAIDRRPAVVVLADPGLVRAGPGTALGAAVRAALDRALDTPGVAVVAVVDRFDDVAGDLRRRRRLDHEVWVPRPDEEARLQLLRELLRPVWLRGVSVEALAHALSGHTPASLKELVHEAMRTADRHRRGRRAPWWREPVVTVDDLRHAARLVRPDAA